MFHSYYKIPFSLDRIPPVTLMLSTGGVYCPHARKKGRVDQVAVVGQRPDQMILAADSFPGYDKVSYII